MNTQIDATCRMEEMYKENNSEIICIIATKTNLPIEFSIANNFEIQAAQWYSEVTNKTCPSVSPYTDVIYQYLSSLPIHKNVCRPEMEQMNYASLHRGEHPKPENNMTLQLANPHHNILNHQFYLVKLKGYVLSAKINITKNFIEPHL